MASGLQPPTEAQTYAGQILTNSFVLANWYNGIQFLLNPPAAFLLAGAAQTITNTTQTGVQYTVTTLDTYSGHNNSTNPDRYVFQVPGWYEISGTFVSGATTSWSVMPAYSPTSGGSSVPILGGKASYMGNGSIVYTATVEATATGDYCNVLAYQSSGSSQTTAYSTGTTGAGPNVCSMQVLWIHQ